jgi:sugar/nucleoside kinase (ribokinase family)
MQHRAGERIFALDIDNGIGLQRQTTEPAIHLGDIGRAKADARQPLARGVDHLADAIGLDADAAGRHQFHGHVIEGEQHPIRAVTAAPPGGRPAQQRDVGGFARLDVLDEDDDVVETRDHRVSLQRDQSLPIGRWRAPTMPGERPDLKGLWHDFCDEFRRTGANLLAPGPHPIIAWTDILMQALFIGQTYIDVTFITDHLPTGDEKHVAEAYAVSFGGNAVTAAFCCAKLGIVPDLICTVANDWLGRMFQDMSAKYGISVHPRKVNASSLSFIMPKDGKRAIVRCRDDKHIHPFPLLNLGSCRALHIDGHQPDAAIHYARLCREAGILTSLDGGGLRTNTHDLLEYIDVAIVAERLCEQMDLTTGQMLDYLKGRGCKVGGITMGEKGLLWYDETGAVHTMPALPIPLERVIDTNGAGDVFHGAYIYSYLAYPGKSWSDHFDFARAASTHKIQRLGNEAGLPTLADIVNVRQEFSVTA